MHVSCVKRTTTFYEFRSLLLSPSFLLSFVLCNVRILSSVSSCFCTYVRMNCCPLGPVCRVNVFVNASSRAHSYSSILFGFVLVKSSLSLYSCQSLSSYPLLYFLLVLTCLILLSSLFLFILQKLH